MTYRLQVDQDKANKQKKEIEEAQAQLLKLQLSEACEKHSSKKKEKEANKTMMIVNPQAGPAPDWPDLGPNLYPDDRKPPRQRRPAGNWGADRSQRGRGGSWREALGLVVQGILAPTHGMSTNVPMWKRRALGSTLPCAATRP